MRFGIIAAVAPLAEPTGDEVTGGLTEPARGSPVLRRWGYCGCAAVLTLSIVLNFALAGVVVYQRELLAKYRQGKSLPVLIPIEYSTSGHPIIPVEVNGETFWWMLDTGSACTVIYEERFPATKYVRRVSGTSTITYPLLGLRIQGHRGVVDDLRVSGLLLPRQPIVIERLANYPESKRPVEPISGVLGTDLLRHYRCVLADGYLRLEPSRADIPPHAVPIEWGPIGNNPVFTAHINGRPLKTLLDTGIPTNTPFLTLRSDVQRQIAKQKADLHLRVGKLNIRTGYYSHAQPKFPVDYEALFGVQMLRFFRVIIDFPRQRIWFEPLTPNSTTVEIKVRPSPHSPRGKEN